MRRKPKKSRKPWAIPHQQYGLIWIVAIKVEELYRVGVVVGLLTEREYKTPISGDTSGADVWRTVQECAGKHTRRLRRQFVGFVK